MSNEILALLDSPAPAGVTVPDELYEAAKRDAEEAEAYAAELEKERDEWKSLAEATIKDDASKNIYYAELQAKLDEALNQLDSARHSVDVLEQRVAALLAAEARIEELENARRKTFQALLRVTEIHDEVEAQLAKALDALELADAALSGANMNTRVVEKKAKAAIAELKALRGASGGRKM
jgi:chromosome segregation ATPase